MNFSEREGHKNPKDNPLESMDGSLKNAIWTEVYSIINGNDYISWDSAGYSHSYRGNYAQLLWSKLFQKNISNLPSPQYFSKEIDSLYKKLEWNEVYDLVEFLLEQNGRTTAKFNKILTEQNSAYRIINSIIQPITSNEVVNAMESASNNALSKEIKEHLQKAEKLYSNKQNPDFNSSCLESIQSVEGTCRLILDNKKILGDNIKVLKKSKSHSQHIIAALEKLNAFRGNDVAHAKDKDSYILNREDAILIHTICCGYVNYFKTKKLNK
jgi:hypothetical protein